ncbi:MAG: metallophosphoesterase [bacterium]
MGSIIHFPSSEPKLEEVELSFSRIPQGTELTIALLSDLHIRGSTNLKSVFSKIETLSPSLLFLLGDYFYIPYKSKVEEFTTFLSRVNPPLGKFAILGNGDDEEVFIKIFSKANVCLLNDSYFLFNIGTARILLIGINYQTTDISSFLSSLPSADLSILLSHKPDVILSPRVCGKIDLVVSGHTHGGQIRLPFLGAIFTKSRLPRRYAQGLSNIFDTYLYVSRGIGMSKIPIRFLCPPEITLLHIKGV